MVSQLGWKPLAERRREHRLSLLYKIINGLVAMPADTHLHFNTRNTRLSNSKSLKLPICTTGTFRHFFFPATIRDWNLLPDDIVNCKNLSSLKETIDGIIKQLKKINPNKANGPDKVPARFLKETVMECGAMFHHLFCQSYQHGTLPSHWTHALVCPIYKKGKKSEPVNYRPVSLTAILCKIMEHCVFSNIWSHLNKHSIITSKQHGFRRGMSCETQLIEAKYDWTNILNKGNGQIDVILLDFSKAFDVVPHHRLLMKLYMYGITGKTHRWIEDFLGNITQEVVVNGSKSECGMVKSGVPQGTVLGPLLFLIYINNIESQIASSISLFADDSALYRPIYSESDSLSLQEDIFKLQ